MQRIAEDTRLPADIDAQPPVQAAAVLRSVIRGYRAEIEREQRLPKAIGDRVYLGMDPGPRLR
jgi:indole-3-acetate monooxygenase